MGAFNSTKGSYVNFKNLLGRMDHNVPAFNSQIKNDRLSRTCVRLELFSDFEVEIAVREAKNKRVPWD